MHVSRAPLPWRPFRSGHALARGVVVSPVLRRDSSMNYEETPQQARNTACKKPILALPDRYHRQLERKPIRPICNLFFKNDMFFAIFGCPCDPVPPATPLGCVPKSLHSPQAAAAAALSGSDWDPSPQQRFRFNFFFHGCPSTAA